MRKVLLLFLLVFFLSGCTLINNQNINKLVNDITSSNFTSNQYRYGYKYYLPNSINVYKYNSSNVVFSKNNVRYYMYVDLISYYYRVNDSYVVNPNAYLSFKIKNNDKFGYVEVNVKNDKYLIEIMYNYAKIEVIVDENDISNAIVDSLLILSSINYSDDLIVKMLEDDTINYGEESFNIFDTNSDDSNFLKVVEEFDNYKSDEVPDYDLIKEN